MGILSTTMAITILTEPSMKNFAILILDNSALELTLLIVILSSISSDVNFSVLTTSFVIKWSCELSIYLSCNYI